VEASFKSTHQTYDFSSPSKFDFDGTPTTADEVFAPSSFDQKVENAFYLASSGLRGDLDDVWKSLDLVSS
jgi:hypothetical protein